ncbi:MAG TPA: hypothetical protein VGM68_02835, partial [Rhizomicrobium sp.]
MSAERKQRLWRIARWTGGIAGGLAVLLALLLWTPPGHRAIEWIVAKATDGEVIVEGLDGGLPVSARASKIELRDANGAWLRVSDARVEWSPLAALGNHYEVTRAAAAKLEFLRRPLPSKPSEGESPRIDVYSLSLPHIDIAPTLMGHPAMLAARGSLNFTSIHEFGVDVAITRPGGNDRYILKGHVTADVINGVATIAESPDGLFGKVTGMPGLGAIALSAEASGDSRANAVAFNLTSGPLSAKGQGTIALARARADIDFTAQSAAMQLDAETGWDTLSAEGHMHGAFAAPEIDARLNLLRLHAAGFKIETVEADVRGTGGAADLTAKATGTRLPDSAYAGVFAATPFDLTAHIDLNDAARPARFQLRHRLLELDGTARTKGAQNAQFNLTVPSLAPFAALAGADLAGSARLKVDVALADRQITLDLDGGIAASGASLVARMLGRDAKLIFHTQVAGSDVLDTRVRL